MALTNTQYQEIMRMYDQEKQNRARALEVRIAKVHAQIPEIAELDASVSRLAVAQARKALMGESHSSTEFRAQMEAIRARKQLLLAAGGFPANYMEHQYACPMCKDTGYVNRGKCRCFRQKEINLLYRQSNLQQILARENFETFNAKWFDPKPYGDQLSPRDNILRVRQICQDMVADFPASCQSFLFTGNAGTGKTFMTHCIAKALMDACYSVVYLSAANLFDVFSRHQFQNEEDSDLDLMYRQIYECDYLIIDDLGIEVMNNFTLSALFSCINERGRQGKGLAISTNLTLGEIQSHYSERISSRLIQNCKILNLYGPDIRIQKALANM